MPDTKISALTAATTPLAGTEVVPLVQSGVTKQVTVASLTAGRSPSMNYAITQFGLQLQNSGVSRWFIEREPGSSDDLFVYRYNDAGGYAGNPLQISRSNGNVRLEGSLVLGTAGKGVDFTANGGDVLTQYDEGTWTPTDASGAGLGLTIGAASYTRIGRQVNCFAWITYPATGSGLAMKIGGLPFNVKSTNDGAGVSMYCSAGFQLFIRPDSTTVFVSVKNDNTGITNANLSGALIGIQLTYFI